MFSLVLPTYNEAKNLPKLLPKIKKALKGVSFEIIVVDDDSPDKTWKVAEGITGVRVIRRVGRRGLSSAVIEGFIAAKGEVLAVMDADGQHDVDVLTKLNKAVKSGATVAIGTRYIKGGGVGEWNAWRHFLSRTATILTTIFCGVRVHDPMSGFFAVDQKAFKKVKPQLSARGFKILLDILVRLPKNATIEEVPYTFGMRMHGESKLSWKVNIAFLAFLIVTALKRTQFILFLIACIVALALWGPRALSLGKLYLDSNVRLRTAEAMQHLEEQEGWLISDMILTDVTDDRLTLLYQQHHRGEDPVSCYHITFDSFDLKPCDSL